MLFESATILSPINFYANKAIKVLMQPQFLLSMFDLQQSNQKLNYSIDLRQCMKNALAQIKQQFKC